MSARLLSNKECGQHNGICYGIERVVSDSGSVSYIGRIIGCRYYGTTTIHRSIKDDLIEVLHSYIDSLRDVWGDRCV